MAVRTGWFGGLGEGGEADVDHLLPRPEHFGITVCQTDLFQCADQIEFVIERGLRERRIAVDPFEYGALVFVRNGVGQDAHDVDVLAVSRTADIIPQQSFRCVPALFVNVFLQSGGDRRILFRFSGPVVAAHQVGCVVQRGGQLQRGDRRTGRVAFGRDTPFPRGGPVGEVPVRKTVLQQARVRIDLFGEPRQHGADAG